MSHNNEQDQEIMRALRVAISHIKGYIPLTHITSQSSLDGKPWRIVIQGSLKSVNLYYDAEKLGFYSDAYLGRLPVTNAMIMALADQLNVQPPPPETELDAIHMQELLAGKEAIAKAYPNYSINTYTKTLFHGLKVWQLWINLHRSDCDLTIRLSYAQKSGWYREAGPELYETALIALKAELAALKIE
jgi:hypothetical protein